MNRVPTNAEGRFPYFMPREEQHSTMPENYQYILTDRDENVGIVTLNRPNALNALNNQIVAELADALVAFDQDESIRCIVITGAGDRAFAAGADIKEMSDK